VQRYNFFPNKQALFLIILNKSFCLLIINQLYSNLISSFLSLRALAGASYPLARASMMYVTLASMRVCDSH
jgi:hypothetical protein